MESEFIISNKPYKISLQKKESGYIASIDGEDIKVEHQQISDNCFSMFIGDKSYTVYYAEDKGKFYISLKGEQFILQDASELRERSIAKGGIHEGSDGAVLAPMPGQVLKINVKEGDEVEVNQCLAIVEAMKMENEVRAPIKGRVKKIKVAVGTIVNPEEPIMELEKIE